MSEIYVTYRVWDGCKAPMNLEYGGRLIGQIAREHTTDRDALLALADELDMCADGCRRSDRAPLTAEEVWECARRIREACGEGER